MPHVAVYQGSGASSVYSGVHGPDSHLKLSLFVLFLVNPPFGKDIHVRDLRIKTSDFFGKGGPGLFGLLAVTFQGPIFFNSS